MKSTQHRNSDDLNRQVANATGDDIETIERLGFSMLGPNTIEERDRPLIIDWDLHHGI